MSEIWKIVAEMALTLHPDRISCVADKIETVASPCQLSAAKGSFGPSIDQALYQAFERAWENDPGVKPAELAAAFRAAAVTASSAFRRESVDLVWSGPSTGLIPVRYTEQVLCEVIHSATTEIFLVSFVAYNVSSVVGALNDAHGRGVRVEILLESSFAQGGTVKNTDSVETIKASVPGASLYVWTSEPERFGARPPNASVHAKSVVADGEVAFITSANLSVSAMERNMELGVLVRGGHLPICLADHLRALKTTGVIQRV